MSSHIARSLRRNHHKLITSSSSSLISSAAPASSLFTSTSIFSHGNNNSVASASSPSTLYTPLHTAHTRNMTARVRGKFDPKYNFDEGISLVRSFAKATFDESIELSINTGLDPRKPNQNVKATAALPHGTGKKVTVLCFARGAKIEEAKKAGADVVGGEELVHKIQSGEMDHVSRVIATPDMMPIVAKVARYLGPRGMMPNPKMGTVTMDVEAAISTMKKGQIQFKTDRDGIIHTVLGKMSFSDAMLRENFDEVVNQVLNNKPSGGKGSYLRGAVMSSTMGKGIRLDITIAPFRKSANTASA